MNGIRGDTLDGVLMGNTLHGQIHSTAGKMGSAIYLDGQQSFIDLGDKSDTCLGDLSLCQYGITISFWAMYGEIRDGVHILDSGERGFRIYLDGRRLWVEFQRTPVTWSTSWDGPQVGRWHFIEVSWHPDDGLRMWVDLDLVAYEQSSSDQLYSGSSRGQNLYIGRASSDDNDRFPVVTLDDLEMWYGNRERLLYFDFIQRGKSKCCGLYCSQDGIHVIHLT